MKGWNIDTEEKALKKSSRVLYLSCFCKIGCSGQLKNFLLIRSFLLFLHAVRTSSIYVILIRF